ncbi:hypothetical protein B4Q13_20675, partial [Lacticaseibacillus rhamnosus]
ASEGLMPDEIGGYSTQPVELVGVAPAGSTLKNLLPRDPKRGDTHVHAVLDLYGDRRYDIYWNEAGQVRRNGVGSARRMTRWPARGLRRQSRKRPRTGP